MNTTAKLESQGHSVESERSASGNNAGTVLSSIQQSHTADRAEAGTVLLSSEMAQLWLAWQCRMVAGVIRGIVVNPGDEQAAAEIISVWPDNQAAESQLIDVAGIAFEQESGVIRAQQHYGPEQQRSCDMVSTPLVINGEPVAAVAVMMSTRSEPQQQAVLQLLQWGGLWIETLLDQQTDPQLNQYALTHHLISAALVHADPQMAAMDVVNQLADKLDCERVSLGLRKGMSIQLQAISNMANFDSRSELLRRIETTMEEAVDQGHSLTYPNSDSGESVIDHAHAKLSRQQGKMAVCTIPLPGSAGFVGAITLERDGDSLFDAGDLQSLNALAALLGPALEMKIKTLRSPLSGGADALKGVLKKVFGPQRLRLKAGLAGLVLLVTALSIIPGSYKVTAAASIEGAVRQMLVAPQAGFIKQADVRAGDRVKQGDIIALLEDRNLKLRRQKWVSERNKIDREYQEALATRDRAQLSILLAQIDQIAAEINLVDEQIAQTQLRAPFDGIVVKGDLSQSLGAPVETGQALFEIAPLDSYRIVLEVDEHDVSGIEAGKPGRLVMAALPTSVFTLTLDKLRPVAVSGEGNNYFRVEASLSEPSELLRPGMRGVARVEVGERSLLWILTHSLVDRIRLWAWSAGW